MLLRFAAPLFHQMLPKAPSSAGLPGSSPISFALFSTCCPHHRCTRKQRAPAVARGSEKQRATTHSPGWFARRRLLSQHSTTAAPGPAFLPLFAFPVLIFSAHCSSRYCLFAERSYGKDAFFKGLRLPLKRTTRRKCARIRKATIMRASRNHRAPAAWAARCAFVSRQTQPRLRSVLV
jgi:hypothetical protein